jgi:hypothetical protein
MKAKEGFDWHWFAGFFDGEGCIFIAHQRPANNYQLSLSIAQKVRGPLQYIYDHIGGKIRLDAGYYRWNLNGLPAKEILVEVEPMLRAKRGEANIALWYPVSLHKDQLHDKQTGRILPDPPLKKILQHVCWDAFRTLRGRKELPNYE